MNIFRRLALSRLLLLCALIVVVGVSATALASALGSAPTPSPKPLAQAVHDALATPSVQGVSANITLTNHLVEGASLASGGGQAGSPLSSPLVNGGSGRLWISSDGKLRLELQAEKGDTEIYYDGSALSAYDAATNTLYRLKPAHDEGAPAQAGQPVPSEPAKPAGVRHEAPSVAKIEEALAHLREHMNVSGATPADVAGQPAYTIRVSPKESGSLLAGAELSFDAVHGVPLRAAVYSTASSAPVIELAASEISYGPVDSSVFWFTPPPDAKVQEIQAAQGAHQGAAQPDAGGERPKLTSHGDGAASIAVFESEAHGAGNESAGAMEGLPKVDINGTSASELRTELGTILTFERSGIRYVLAGSVPPAAVEAVAKGL